MPYVAIGDGNGVVTTNHGCDSATTTKECSQKVFIGGVGVVLMGHKNTSHTYPVGNSCPNHQVSLSTGSDKVFVENKQLGRENDFYSEEKITSAGQTKVNAG